MLPRHRLVAAAAFTSIFFVTVGSTAAQDLIGVYEVGIAAGGYAAVGEMSQVAAGAAGGGSRLVLGFSEVGGLVGLVDIQGLVFLPEPPDTSLAGWIAALGVGYRLPRTFPPGVNVGLHLSYGVSLLQVDGKWGNTAFDGAWHAGHVGAVDIDVALAVGTRFAVFLQPRYMVTPEEGFLGHLIGGQVGVRYQW
jgi:hypothetical protein